MLSPLQWFPSLDGQGESQLLSRLQRPTPHVELHVPQSVHPPHPPWTVKEGERNFPTLLFDIKVLISFFKYFTFSPKIYHLFFRDIKHKQNINRLCAVIDKPQTPSIWIHSTWTRVKDADVRAVVRSYTVLSPMGRRGVVTCTRAWPRSASARDVTFAPTRPHRPSPIHWTTKQLI